MPPSYGKGKTETNNLEKVRAGNKIRITINLHGHVNLTCKNSSYICNLVKDLKGLKREGSTTKLIDEIDRRAQKTIDV